MGWIFAVVALGLVMAALTLAELQQSLRAMTVGDRVVAVFVLSTCILVVTGLVLLAAEILP